MVREHLTTELNQAMDARLRLRARIYGTGAAIGMLLDRLEVAGWMIRLQEGATFHHLLTEAVSTESG